MELQPIDDHSSDGAVRRRVVAGVIAAMLVAGVGGVGYGLGRSADDGAPSAAPLPTVLSTPTSRGSAPTRPSRPTHRPR